MRQWVRQYQGDGIFRNMYYDESVKSVNDIGELERLNNEDI